MSETQKRGRGRPKGKAPYPRGKSPFNNPIKDVVLKSTLDGTVRTVVTRVKDDIEFREADGGPIQVNDRNSWRKWCAKHNPEVVHLPKCYLEDEE